MSSLDRMFLSRLFLGKRFLFGPKFENGKPFVVCNDCALESSDLIVDDHRSLSIFNV